MEYFRLFYSTSIMFVIVIVVMRLMGKRQIGELELSEFVVAVMISEMAAMPVVDPEMSLIHGIIPVVTLLMGELVISLLSLKNIKFREIVSGKPSIVVEEGKVIRRELKKNRFTLDELTEELRAQGITDISTVKYAILEISGKLSAILYNAHKPVTQSAMNIQQEDCGLPVLVINDGRVLTKNLQIMGLNEGWLRHELERRNIKGPEDVFIMSVDERNNIYFRAME